MNIPLRLAAVCALSFLLLAGGCGKKPAPEKPLPAVTVSQPRLLPVQEYLELTGTAAASRSVDLVARVGGFLQTVNFKDGDRVEAGQLLFLIEPGPYEQQVALDEAVLVQAQSEYDRQQALMKENATSTASVEKQLSQRDQARAQLEIARINLGYTRVTAPFAGRIGARQVDPGNLVGATGPTTLATLEQLVPIYVYFNLNERDALHLREMMRSAGMLPKTAVGTAPVFAGLSNEEGYPHAGVLDFTDNNISGSTGTVSLRALFSNESTDLFPGLFVRVRIPLGDPRPMLVIPDVAIGNDQQGDFVYVVDSSQVVSRRSIVKGSLAPEGRAIQEGLDAQDRVVVNGLLNARPGEKVSPRQDDAPAPAATN